MSTYNICFHAEIREICCSEVLLKSTHNMCFHESNKIIRWLPILPGVMRNVFIALVCISLLLIGLSSGLYMCVTFMLTLVMLNKLRCHGHLLFSANQIP